MATLQKAAYLTDGETEDTTVSINNSKNIAVIKTARQAATTKIAAVCSGVFERYPRKLTIYVYTSCLRKTPAGK